MKNAIAMLMFSAWSLSATAADAVQCDVPNKTYSSIDLKCPLQGAEQPLRYRFKVGFSGGHDDTQADLVALDGTALAGCDEGSKTHLFGEEGEVSLECTVTVPAGLKDKPPLELRVKWTHCDYMEHSFTREAL
ncbi:hypothetical protein [Hydrocarboniphaga effusa]|uniref:hypothetical protein n=1 Tax=Hydrocarboniphaga effusa TaxID=243629 RepID=UPI0035B1B9F7